jgi:hypothetical protein
MVVRGIVSLVGGAAVSACAFAARATTAHGQLADLLIWLVIFGAPALGVYFCAKDIWTAARSG